MSRRAASLPALVLLLAACTADTTTAPLDTRDIAASRGASARPLDGRCETTFAFVAPVPGQAPNVQRLAFAGACQISHLGHTSVVAQQTVSFGPTGTTVTNTATYTAANGDQLRSSYVATGTFPDAAGNVCFSGTETYDGGTGRFADASGTSRLDGCASVVTFTGSYTIDGALGY